MLFGSLFAGAGGLDLGLEAAGMTCAFQVEIDDYASKVLARHWPDVPRWRDIREVNTDDLPAIDLLCGGFPCQPHSLAGERRGSEDERDLWGEYVRFIRGTQPRWVVAENVAGLLSTESGRFFGRVLADLAALGFDAEWSVLSACAFGAPHPRERLFIVAHAQGAGRQRGRRAGARSPLLEPFGRGEEHRRPRTAEPRPFGVAYGVADRAHRLRLAGNGVYPPAAEHIGRMILAAD